MMTAVSGTVMFSSLFQFAELLMHVLCQFGHLLPHPSLSLLVVVLTVEEQAM